MRGYRSKLLACKRMASLWDILMPGGKPIGVAGTKRRVREITGSNLEHAEDMFNALTAGGTQVAASPYPGVLIALPGGGTVGLRKGSKKGPPTIATIDVQVPGFPIRKVKFNA
jgi:hypothetical protein